MALPSHPFLSLLSSNRGQLLTRHYSAISLALPHAAEQTAKHTYLQMAVLVSLKRGKRGKWHLVVNLNVAELARAWRFVNMRR